MKRNLDERDARWHEAAKDATVILTLGSVWWLGGRFFHSFLMLFACFCTVFHVFSCFFSWFSFRFSTALLFFLHHFACRRRFVGFGSPSRKPHLKPRLSPRGKENMELQRQLEEQRGLMHKIKRHTARTWRYTIL